MQIQFYGHSIAARNRVNKFDTFVDKLVQKYCVVDPDYEGIAKCSEERILYNLKKTKTIDLAIIFHADPKFYFCPTFFIDSDKVSEKEFHQAGYVKPLVVYPELRTDSRIDKNIDHQTLTLEETKNIIRTYQDYFFTPESNKNRHNGALIQIDQYLTAKTIPVIHLLQDKNHVPNWFKFSSGIVDYDIAPMQHDNSQYSCSYSRSCNAITEEGNDIIFNKIVNYINSFKI